MDREERYLDQRVFKTKTSLEESLLKLMEQKTFSDIYVTDIINGAGLNRGSFYNHYKDKENLLDTIMEKKNDELIYAYREPFLNNRPYIVSKLPASEVKLFNNIQKNAEYYSIMLNSDDSGRLENKISDSFRKINLEELNVKTDKINSEMMASYMAHAIVGLIKEWVRGGYQHEAEFMNEQLLELNRTAPNKTFHNRIKNFRK